MFIIFFGPGFRILLFACVHVTDSGSEERVRGEVWCAGVCASSWRREIKTANYRYFLKPAPNLDTGFSID